MPTTMARLMLNGSPKFDSDFVPAAIGETIKTAHAPNGTQKDEPSLVD